MTTPLYLVRFLSAQNTDYDAALSEINHGKKTGHWMWFIFPQISGLGRSATAKFFAIQSLSDATHYFNHPVLGSRLVEISTALLALETDDAVAVFGSVDSVKLKSSMTLFSLAQNKEQVFQKVLDRFFNGQKDSCTINIVIP